jgi:hypothetical protein
MFSTGARQFVGTNPPREARIYYVLNHKTDKVSLKVYDYAGKLVRELTAKGDPGLNVATWDMTRSALAAGGQPPAAAGTGGPGGEGGEGQPQGRGQGPGGRRGPPTGGGVPAGTYKVVLTVDGEEFVQGLRIEGEAAGRVPFFTEDEDEPGAEQEKEKQREERAGRRDDD